jgi:UDP-galactopyranose mutase
MLDHPQIEVKLGVNYERSWNQDFSYVFYTGPLDTYFNRSLGSLAYRSIYFEKEYAEGDYQGNAVINYCQTEVPYTRVHEHKHFTPWDKHPRTFYIKEFSKETGPDDIPYYPKRLVEDKHTLSAYRQLAEQEQKVFFLGRLATYRYMDMHHVIGEALSFCRQLLQIENWEHAPHFPNEET